MNTKRHILKHGILLPAALALRVSAAGADFEVKPLPAALAAEYQLAPAFYKKATLVQGILIATSSNVPDVVTLEAACQFDMVMRNINPEAAQRIRDRKVLCVLVNHRELTSNVPQFVFDNTGRELDCYNWRQRGFLSEVGGRRVVLFAGEDVLEYEGGMQLESILIHEFGHVIDFAGFDKALKDRLTAAFQHAKEKGLYQDGYAAQRFRRVKSDAPVSLLDALSKSFPDQKPELLRACLDGGDILVNGKPTQSDLKVTKDDKVLIVFGGPKSTCSLASRAEYGAEGLQNWYDTNRTMDHDHNHTRAQLKSYDPELAQLCADVLGDSDWRFVSPRLRTGTGHLAGYDPATAPKVENLEHIDLAAQDYYDTYCKEFWKRLREKYPEQGATRTPGK